MAALAGRADLMDQLVPGESILNLVLSPNGHVELELHLVDDGSTVWITTESSQEKRDLGRAAGGTGWIVGVGIEPREPHRIS